MTFKMEKWQIEMVNEITITHPNYASKEALELANEWSSTDEKFVMIMDYFGMSANDVRVDYWVAKIENELEKILKANETSLNKNAQSWLWLCNQ